MKIINKLFSRKKMSIEVLIDQKILNSILNDLKFQVMKITPNEIKYEGYLRSYFIGRTLCIDLNKDGKIIVITVNMGDCMYRDFMGDYRPSKLTKENVAALKGLCELCCINIK